MRTPQRARIERLEGKTRVAAPEASSGAREVLSARLTAMADRLTPEDRASLQDPARMVQVLQVLAQVGALEKVLGRAGAPAFLANLAPQLAGTGGGKAGVNRG